MAPPNKPTDGSGTDATMDGRAPIAAGPEVPAALATDPNFNAQVESEVARRVQVSDSGHAAAVEAATAQGARDTALTQLNAMIDGNPGETLDAMKLRDSLRGMVNEMLSGSDKPPGEFLAEAARLSEARAQQLAATSGDDFEVTISSERFTPMGTVAATKPSPAPTWARCSASRSGSAKAWTARS